MLSDTDFFDYCHQHCLINDAKEHLLWVRESDILRMHNSYPRESFLFGSPSIKIGFTNSFTSYSAEEALVLCREIELNIDRQTTPTPETGKVEPQSQKNRHKSLPSQRTQSNGQYPHPPGNNILERSFLHYSVPEPKSKRNNSRANIKILLASRGAAAREPATFLRVKIVLKDRFCMSLADLKNALQLKSYTEIIQLIDDEALACNLNLDLLSEPARCWVSENNLFLSEARAIIDSIETQPAGVSMPTRFDADIALKRLNRIKSGDSGKQINRWLQRIEQGNAVGLTPFQSLLPKKYLPRKECAFAVALLLPSTSFIKNRGYRPDRRITMFLTKEQ